MSTSLYERERKQSITAPSDGTSIQIVKVQPYYKQLLQKILQLWREDVDEEYGPPYIKNKSLEAAFLREVKEKRCSLEFVHTCLAARIDPNIPAQYNNRAIHYAAKHGNSELIRMLVRSGASVNIYNDDEDTPMMIASRETTRRYAKCVKLILSANDGDHEQDSTDLEGRYGQSNTVTFMLDHGAMWQRNTTYEGNNDEYDTAVVAKSFRATQAEQHFLRRSSTKPSILDRIKKRRAYLLSNISTRFTINNSDNLCSLGIKENLEATDEDDNRRCECSVWFRLMELMKNVRQCCAYLRFQPNIFKAETKNEDKNPDLP